MRPDLWTLQLGEKRGDRSAVEEPPLDRATLDNCALRLREQVDARGEERLQRRGHLELAVPALGVHRDKPLDQRRVRLGPLHDPPAGHPEVGRKS